MTLVTTDWYGFYTFKNSERKAVFQDIVVTNFAEHVYPHVYKIIFPTEDVDLTDIMYTLVATNPTWYTKNTLHNRLWILGIAHFIYKVRGQLEFSDVNKKHFYWDKISVITQEVDRIITGNIAKDFLAKVCGCALLGVCLYKYTSSLMRNITDLLTRLP
jgi:hypothetical protein